MATGALSQMVVVDEIRMECVGQEEPLMLLCTEP
jgi:hypothetical protein